MRWRTREEIGDTKGTGMFYSVGIPGILPARNEKETTGSTNQREKAHASMTAEESANAQGKGTSIPDDAGALSMLYEEFRHPIHGYIYRLLGNQEDADDVTQEVFVRACLAWDNLYDRSHLSAWLYRIATNQVRSEWRRHKNVKIVPFTTPQLGEDHTFDEQGEDFLVSHEQFEEGVMQRELVRRTLSQLPEASVTCLLMDAEGFSARFRRQIRILA